MEIAFSSASPPAIHICPQLIFFQSNASYFFMEQTMANSEKIQPSPVSQVFQIRLSDQNMSGQKCEHTHRFLPKVSSHSQWSAKRQRYILGGETSMKAKLLALGFGME